ncbi:hypothetical protein [Legionella tunisiensis]|uniref:hypothetical protein n=1 Tax=Legionella tunisiensis TaxID=1034944 RepID=UPI000474C0F6|nr:hypothetical protein [Legionella tunisiensis]
MGLVILQVAISNHYWPLFIFIIPLAFLFTRLFVLQHDLGHGNLFKKENIMIGLAFLLGLSFLHLIIIGEKHTLFIMPMVVMQITAPG